MRGASGSRSRPTAAARAWSAASTRCPARARRRGLASTCRALDRVLEVDPVSRAARIQAGAAGPRLEEQLAAHGLTLRFFPQSFELSTLGGWIATRAAGHFATGPTHIDDLVESVRARDRRAATCGNRGGCRARAPGRRPTGCCSARRARSAVITEAWVRVRRGRRSGAGRARRASPTFEAGCEAVRAIVQAGLQPANCRLIDPARGGADVRGRRLGGAARARLRGRASSRARRGRSRSAATHGGEVTEGRGGGAGAWREAFLRAPYLRDTFVRMGVLIETFETAITWERLPARASIRAPCARRWPARPRSPAGSRTPTATARRPTSPSGAGAARRRGRAVVRDQAAAADAVLGRGRHDHPPPRGRPRPPALVRPPAPRAVRRGLAGGEGGPRPGRPPQPRGTLGAAHEPRRVRQEHAGRLQGQGAPRQDLPLGRQGHRRCTCPGSTSSAWAGRRATSSAASSSSATSASPRG